MTNSRVRMLISLSIALLTLARVAALHAEDAAHEDDTRTQYPVILKDLLFNVAVGGIDSEFSSAQFSAGSRGDGQGRVPLTSRVDVYGECGLGITSRHGFSSASTIAVPDVHYVSAVSVPERTTV